MTVEQLLKLPSEGFEAIAAMTDEQALLYFKDITDLEPKGIIDVTRQLVGLEDKDDNEGTKEVDEPLSNDGIDNPFKKVGNGKKSSKSKTSKKKKLTQEEEIEMLRQELGVD